VTKSTLNYPSSSQKTIKKAVSFSGQGVFTDAAAKITLYPADVDTGVVFVVKGTLIPALAEYTQQKIQGFTALQNENAKVQTVEHLLSALYALSVDNVRIEVEGSEIPMLDGSAKPFVEGLLNTGFSAQ